MYYGVWKTMCKFQKTMKISEELCNQLVKDYNFYFITNTVIVISIEKYSKTSENWKRTVL